MSPDQIPIGYCQCGCGQRTNVPTESNRNAGWIKGRPTRFVKGHNTADLARSGSKHPAWNGGAAYSQGYVLLLRPDHPHATKAGRVRRSRLMAEAALGRYLKPHEEVHHVDGVRDHDVPGNLVVCPDKAYHWLLERRTRALRACGNASWRKCEYCHEWDDPQNMWINPKREAQAWHRACAVKASAARKRRLREAR